LLIRREQYPGKACFCGSGFALFPGFPIIPLTNSHGIAPNPPALLFVHLDKIRYNLVVAKSVYKQQIILLDFKPDPNERVKAGFVAREAAMGKYIGYLLIVLVIIALLEFFQIIDIPYFDLPDLQTKGEQLKTKSEDNMKRRFGD